MSKRVYILVFTLAALVSTQCTKLPERPTHNNPFDHGLPDVFTATVTLAQGGALISWNPTSIPFDHILLYRGVNPSPDSMRLFAWVPGDSTRYLDRTIREGYIYYYSLVGENSDGRTVATPQLSLPLLLPILAIDGDSAFTSIREVGLTAIAFRATSIWLGSSETDAAGRWQPMQNALQFRLSDGRGMKYVYARFAFSTGDTSHFLVDSVRTLPITGRFITPNNRMYFNSIRIPIFVISSGASVMRFSEDSTFTGVPFIPVTQVDTITVSNIDGQKHIFGQFDNSFDEPQAADTSLRLVLDRQVSVLSVEENSNGQVLAINQSVTFTLRTPELGGQAWIRLVDSLGGIRDSISLTDELNNGTFTTQYEVNFGNNIERGWVVGYYQDLATNVASDTANTRITIELGLDEMVQISGGTFLMGTNNGAADEQPVHSVTVSSFAIDRYEVTNSSFAHFLSANPSNAQYWVSNMRITQNGNTFTAMPQFANHPVRYVSYSAAQAYAQSIGKRIPTEAEWEYAARGSDDLAFPWGNSGTIVRQVNAVPSSRTTPRPGNTIRPDTTTTPVGFYDGNLNMGFQTDNGATPERVFDMAGNVAEWVSDWYDPNYYSISPSVNPQGPATGTNRILKGGSFISIAFDLRSGRRFAVDGQSAYYITGFRCASSRVYH